MAGRGRASVLPAWATRAENGGNEFPSAAGRGSLGSGPSSSGTKPVASGGRGGGGTRPVSWSGSTGGRGGSPASNMNHSMSTLRPRSAPDGWTEYRTEEGEIYYYNTFTQESKYEKPESLMTSVELKLPRSPWKAYVDENRVYYHNSQTNETTWTEPMDFTTYKGRLQALCSGEVPTKDVESREVYMAAQAALQEAKPQLKVEGPHSRKDGDLTVNRVVCAAEMQGYKLEEDPKAPIFELKSNFKAKKNKDDEDFFKQMLLDRGVPAAASWAEALSFGIANEVAFHKIRSLSRKKILFEEYVKTKTELEAKEREEQIKSLREGLQQSLHRLAEEKKVNGSFQMKDVLRVLDDQNKEMMQKWPELSIRARDDVIVLFLKDLLAQELKEKTEREEAELKKLERFLARLLEEKRLKLDGSSTWKEIEPEIEKEIESSVLSKRDQEEMFVEFLDSKIKELKVEMSRMAELAQDEIGSSIERFSSWFEKDLKEMLENGGSLPETFKELWTSDEAFMERLQDQDFFKDISSFVVKQINAIPSFASELVSQASVRVVTSAAEERLDDVIEEIGDLFKVMKKDLKANGLKICPTEYLSREPPKSKSTYVRDLDELLKSLDEDARRKAEDSSKEIRETVFRNLRRDADKKLNKKILHFREMLDDIFSKAKHLKLTKDQAFKRMEQEPEYKDLGADAVLIEKLYKEHMDALDEEVNGPSRTRNGKRSLDKEDEAFSTKRHKR